MPPGCSRPQRLRRIQISPSARRSVDDRQGGFSLVELLVVIIILGILAAVAVPIFLFQRKKAVDASLESDAHSVAIHMEAAYTITEAYPASIGGAVPNLTVGGELIRTSPHNDVRVWRKSAGGDAFCVRVTNPHSAVPASGFVWQSDHGGLQASGADCAGYPTVVL